MRVDKDLEGSCCDLVEDCNHPDIKLAGETERKHSKLQSE
jgi:hypothetical protein